MKKILIVTTIDATIGFFIPQIKYLIKNGYNVEIATRITNDERIKEVFKNIVFHNIPFSRSIRSFSNFYAYLSIKNLIKRKRFDLIHVHTPIASFITRLAINKKQKLVYTAHGFHFNENGSFLTNKIFFWAEKLASYKTSKLIVINSDDRYVANKIINDKKIEFVKGVGIDLEYYNLENFTVQERNMIKENLGIPDNVKVITHIGEFNENKRQIDIIKACELLLLTNDKFVILLVGEGPLRKELIEEIKVRNLSNYIKSLGFRKDIQKILSITDIGLLVSLREGLPRSVMEMMAMKIPTVVTNIRGNRDLVEDKINGFLIPIKSPEKLAEKCRILMSDENLAVKFGSNSYKKVSREMDVRKINSYIDDIYKGLGI